MTPEISALNNYNISQGKYLALKQEANGEQHIELRESFLLRVPFFGRLYRMLVITPQFHAVAEYLLKANSVLEQVADPTTQDKLNATLDHYFHIKFGRAEKHQELFEKVKGGYDRIKEEYMLRRSAYYLLNLQSKIQSSTDETEKNQHLHHWTRIFVSERGRHNNEPLKLSCRFNEETVNTLCRWLKVTPYLKLNFVWCSAPLNRFKPTSMLRNEYFVQHRNCFWVNTYLNPEELVSSYKNNRLTDAFTHSPSILMATSQISRSDPFDLYIFEQYQNMDISSDQVRGQKEWLGGLLG